MAQCGIRLTIPSRMAFKPLVLGLRRAKVPKTATTAAKRPPAEVHRYGFDFAGVTNQGVVAQGQNGHYSPDETGLLYRVQTKSS